MSISLRCKQIRIAKKFSSAEDFANFIGMKPSTWRSIEAGARGVSRKTLIKIMTKCNNINLYFLLLNKGPMFIENNIQEFEDLKSEVAKLREENSQLKSKIISLLENN
jgi:transcriptional regulator with XRE-family HTH domain